MRSRPAGLIEPLLGAAIIVALALGFALLLRSPPPQDVYVRIGGPRTHLLFSDPEDEVKLGPRELKPRVQVVQPDGVSATELLTYRVQYGKRWEREITLPVARGPALPEGEPWPCAVQLRLFPSLFDDGVPGSGGDAVEIIDHQIRAQFPRVIAVGKTTLLEFKKVRSTSISLSTRPEGIVALGTITLDDHESEPTEFRFRGTLELAESGGDLLVKLDKFDLSWSGHTRKKLLVEIVDLVADVEKIAEGVVRAEIAKILPFVKLPQQALRLEDLAVDEGPGIKIVGGLTMKLCGPPVVDSQGVTLGLRASVVLDGPVRKDRGITGPFKLRGAVPELKFRADPPNAQAPAYNLQALASADALQQTLYMLWQSGAFDVWGRDSEVLDNFRAKLQDRLVLTLDELEPRLPPTYVASLPDCDGFGIRFADLRVGHLKDGRTAVVHGDACGTARVRKGRLELEGRLSYVTVNCQRWEGGLTLSPCLSDVIPIVRAQDLADYTLPLSLPIPERLMQVSLVRGASLSLEDLRADTRGPLLDIKARGVLSITGE